jgi:hypothetical protein
MGVLLRAAVLAAVGVTGAPGGGFGQTGDATPPAQETPPAGDPGGPEARPAPALPVPPRLLPPTGSGPGMGGGHCDHERAPATGV